MRIVNVLALASSLSILAGCTARTDVVHGDTAIRIEPRRISQEARSVINDPSAPRNRSQSATAF